MLRGFENALDPPCLRTICRLIPQMSIFLPCQMSIFQIFQKKMRRAAKNEARLHLDGDEVLLEGVDGCRLLVIGVQAVSCQQLVVFHDHGVLVGHGLRKPGLRRLLLGLRGGDDDAEQLQHGPQLGRLRSAGLDDLSTRAPRVGELGPHRLDLHAADLGLRALVQQENGRA